MNIQFHSDEVDFEGVHKNVYYLHGIPENVANVKIIGDEYFITVTPISDKVSGIIPALVQYPVIGTKENDG